MMISVNKIIIKNKTNPCRFQDRGEIHAWVERHLFPAPSSEAAVNPTWAGDLAEEVILYSCATAPDFV
jgi:hypothetical protein